MTKEEILSHIRAERARRGLKLKDAAKAIGIKFSTYQRLEAGLNVGACKLYKALEYYKKPPLK